MNYSSELKKFMTSQYISSAVRISLAIAIPSIVLAYFGVLKEYFLFPLATSFVGLTDMPGPYIRRRNTLILTIISFMFVIGVAGFLKDYPPLIFLELIVFGMFFTLIGVYGIRMAAVGGLTLVVFSIFIDGQFFHHHVLLSMAIFLAGALWFLLVFIVVTSIQPYKLASQMIGENYLELANFLKIKSKFYLQDKEIDQLNREVIAKQVVIKNLQEDTREVVFKTREIVNESTTTSRLLMLMFLNSIDLYEKLFTSENDYSKIHHSFDEEKILTKIHDYLIVLANEISNIGISLQSGIKSSALVDYHERLDRLHQDYFQMRSKNLNADNMEDFMSLRIVLSRINEITKDISTMYQVLNQDIKNAKSLSTGLDLNQFAPKSEKLNLKVLSNHISLQSAHFKNAIRITTALVVGYALSKFTFLGIGHSYWILITILAIMRPAYSVTKHRTLLRVYGTFSGAVVAYFIMSYIHNGYALLGIFIFSMIMCFSFLKDRYAWAVFFMTIYIFLSFNFLSPGQVNVIFKDRIIDTIIAGIVIFLTSYFVFPVWEHSQNLNLMKRSAMSNYSYFHTVIQQLKDQSVPTQEYKMRRKDAIISLANLSDNFQRMLSDPKNQKKKMETVLEFVNTSHLLTAYIASLSQYYDSKKQFTEIDFDAWEKKIGTELQRINAVLNQEKWDDSNNSLAKIQPEDTELDQMLEKRRNQILENEIYDARDPNRITTLTQLTNIRKILELISDVATQLRRTTESYKTNEI
ncbi:MULTISPECIES: FUSC family protein [Amniculibacterium]|uniref:FUSC family protein n=1 Tax=Amniculibacterium TaxID=2715289 RepID=UPI000F5A7566|nr:MULTISPECIES: FUSC family membrane protein [Amniculibacterium]